MKKITGEIHAEQGVVLFHSPEEGVIARYPGNLTTSDYGQLKSVWMYPTTHKLKRKLGHDDVPIDDFDENDFDLYRDVEMLDSLVEEERIRGIPKIMSACASIVACVVVGVASFFLAQNSSIFWALFAGAVILGIYSLFNARSWTKALSSSVVYDCDGAWLNMETGECSLNGGCIISHYVKEDSAL